MPRAFFDADHAAQAAEGSFNTAEARYRTLAVADIDPVAPTLWLAKARVAQWDHSTILRDKGKLGRIGQRRRCHRSVTNVLMPTSKLLIWNGFKKAPSVDRPV
jgi:hypothetical protein